MKCGEKMLILKDKSNNKAFPPLYKVLACYARLLLCIFLLFFRLVTESRQFLLSLF